MDRFISKNKKVIKAHTKTISKEKASDADSLSDEYIQKIRHIAYIGKKGYTISKSSLTNEDIEFLRKDLFVKPQIMGATYVRLMQPHFQYIEKMQTKYIFLVFMEYNDMVFL